MWQIVRDLVADGVTIFLTTQYLDEADQLADRIAVLNHGTLVAEGTSAELKRLIPGGHVELRLTDAEALRRAGAGPRRAAPPTPPQLTLQVPSDGSVGALRELLDRLDQAAVAIDTLSVHTPDLDDVFLALTKETCPMTTMSSTPSATRPPCCAATSSTSAGIRR